ncbi:type IV pilin protein [Oleiagrimonas soli]|uniref:Type IV pilus assembly protein PilE n=2 Tax=Oleiagrimonas soli TaxID=1543381 RepID=A0A841KDJ9_9GAMM|nr:type IV pilin protein [Oleiagrimonas soli]MBB6183693.1 type IV pilus assembly protein PilE [Oleiagrimonas soli]
MKSELLRMGDMPQARGSSVAFRADGFSLVELMVVVAIIAILSAIAIPSYIKHVTKTNRVAAEGCLSEYSNYMERAYTTSLSYPASGSSAAPPKYSLDCATASQTGNNYAYSLDPATSSSSKYTLQATPQGTQQSRDTQCGTLTLDQSGTRTKSGTGTLDECW